jgi:hypothetical protein
MQYIYATTIEDFEFPQPCAPGREAADRYKKTGLERWCPETEWRIVGTAVGPSSTGVGNVMYYTWEQGGYFE